MLSRRGLIATAAASTLALGAEAAGTRLSSARAQGGTTSSTPIAVSTRGADVNGVVALEEDGAEGITSITGSAGWATDPPMRLRVSRADPDTAGAEHFLVIPYEHGIAFEYPGVIELWAGDVSIHNNQQRGFRAAHFWVGNQFDTGGLFATAVESPNGSWAELVSQKFTRESHGDIRFVVRAASDRFAFRAGPPGGEQTVAEVSGEGDLGARGAVAAGGDLEAGGDVNAGGTVGARGNVAAQQNVTAGQNMHAGGNIAADGSLTAKGDISTEGTLSAKGGFVSSGQVVSPSGVRTSGDVVSEGRVSAGRGLAVGNSEKARKPGKVVRRMPVFDSAGRRLGYVPIYNRIGR